MLLVTPARCVVPAPLYNRLLDLPSPGPDNLLAVSFPSGMIMSSNPVDPTLTNHVPYFNSLPYYIITLL